MNSSTYFAKSRHPASAAALALCLTLGMLLSVDGLATQPASAASVAARAAPDAQAMSSVQRSSRS